MASAWYSIQRGCPTLPRKGQVLICVLGDIEKGEEGTEDRWLD